MEKQNHQTVLRICLGIMVFLHMTKSPQAAANESLSPKGDCFLVVDGMRVITESKVVQDIQKQLEKQSAVFQKEVSTQEQRFQEEHRKIQKEQKNITLNDFQKKQADFQRRFEKFQQRVDLRRRQLELAYRTTMNKVQIKVDGIIGRIAQKRGSFYIFHKAALAWLNQNLKIEITDTVVQELNKELPEMKVTIPTEKEVEQLTAIVSSPPTNVPAHSSLSPSS